jgi:hypothetical protein
MRVSSSTNKQQDYWLRKTENGKHYIRIRRNHETFEVENMEGDGMDTYWKCDEIEIRIPLRADIEQYVETNFDALFDAWLLLEG